MVVAVAKAVEDGATAIICASTGNTSASAAAYARCSRARSRRGAAARPDRARQAAAGPRRGARVVAIDGNFDQALAIVRGARRAGRPPGHAGQLGQPASHRRARRPRRSRSATTSGARRTSSRSRSATRATSARTGRASAPTRPRAASARLPRMWGFQAAGAAPLVTGQRVDHPETVATAIRIGDPASWHDGAGRARRVRRA